ncbi:MAG: (Fe-S)-binding protein, partial [Anaerolineae bacterium]|nr:(Fe-S)-binding protein [Anaerolineae bacterium]
MQIELENVKQTTELCRYCLMCRHVCPVTHVTRSEATSPHGWGILIASVERGITTWNEDTVDVLYQCADCGLCRAHCVTDQPLPLAINATRAAVAMQNLAPAMVYTLQAKLARWQNPYVDAAPQPVSGPGQAALIVGAVGQHLQPPTVQAVTRLLQAAGEPVVPVAIGRDSPYLANALGLLAEAGQLAQATLDEIAAVGAKRVYVMSPGDAYAFGTVLEFLGLAWPDGVDLVEVSSFLAQKLAAGQIGFDQAELSDYTFVDPDQTVRFPGRWDAPRTLLATLSQTPPTELFWRKERAAPSGASGGLAFIQPELAAKLTQSRLDEARER